MSVPFSVQERRQACSSVRFPVTRSAAAWGSSPSSSLWAATASSCSSPRPQVRDRPFWCKSSVVHCREGQQSQQVKRSCRVTASVHGAEKGGSINPNPVREAKTCQAAADLHASRRTVAACGRLTTAAAGGNVQRGQNQMLLLCAADFQSFYNLLKNCRGHPGEQSVFSERTEESSAVQYFQVRATRHTTLAETLPPVFHNTFQLLCKLRLTGCR